AAALPSLSSWCRCWSWLSRSSAAISCGSVTEMRVRGDRVLTVIGLVAFLLVVLVPFWWIATMSFKTYEQIQFATSIYVPRPFTWDNYTTLWSGTRFPLWLRNSVV